MDGLIQGRTVHYVLTEQDAMAINQQRKAVNATFLTERVPGLQYHVGNSVEPGEHCAAVVVKVWSKENGYINLKVQLDGQDDYWATSKSYGEKHEPGTWHWIEKA